MEPLYYCERCGKPVYEKFGSGRFCSRACANSRIQDKETNTKRSIAISGTKAYSNEFETIYLKEGEIVPEGFYPGNYKLSSYQFNDFISNKKGETTRLTNMVKARNKLKEDRLQKKLNKKVVVGGDELDITYRELEEYRKTHTVCDICGNPETCSTSLSNKPNKLCIEHDHKTKKFRGLVCNKCNNRLSWLDDNLDSILSYIKKE